MIAFCSMSNELLSVKNLKIDFKSDQDLIPAVKGISFNIPKGKTVGLVGESGSGKSVTSLSIMRLLPTQNSVISGNGIFFKNQNLLDLSEGQIRKIRGNEIAMIFQEPMTSLNPVFTVGNQIVEAIRIHQKMSKAEAYAKAEHLLEKVGIPNPKQRLQSYPHELSGGQRQRVMIAMAISCEPDLLIADEPTTALDVTIQKQILELLADLKSQYNMSMLFITHDLGVIKQVADDVLVMYKGEIVESGSVQNIFNHPNHPYTKGLLSCRPKLSSHTSRLATVSNYLDEQGKSKNFDQSSLGVKKIKPENSEVLLEVNHLKTYFPIKSGIFGRVTDYLKAVDDVSFKVGKGRTLGLVGESGCGKTSLGRSILRLVEPTEGQIIFDGKDITNIKQSELRPLRKNFQIVFQDPYASLNPRMSIASTIMEPMLVHNLGSNKDERYERAVQLLRKVGLLPEHMKRYPHEFSGGQRQRICIARALATEPEFILCDESVSALDVSIQAQILNLLLDLQDEFGLTYIFISHDLSVVKFFSDDVAVMKEGKIVEMASAQKIYESPQHEYTKKLLSALPQ